MVTARHASVPSRLETEQADILVALVEAYRAHREPFLVLEAENGSNSVLFSHPGLKDGMAAPPHDLKMLERQRFLLSQKHVPGIWSFIPTPEALEFYRRIKTEGVCRSLALRQKYDGFCQRPRWSPTRERSRLGSSPKLSTISSILTTIFASPRSATTAASLSKSSRAS